MIYSWALKVEKNTPAKTPVEYKLEMTYGIIHQLDIVFPAGCSGLAHIQIYEGASQIWPTNADESFHTDDETISFKEFYHLKADPFILVAKLWNEDDTYDHTIHVRMGVLQESEIRGVWVPWSEEVIRP